MRRATFLLLLALVSGALPAFASEPGADLGGGQMAEAFWVDLREGTFYFAEGFRVVSSDVPESYVVIGKGRCTRHRMGGGTLVSCSGKGVIKEASVDEFFIDPVLQSAHINMKVAGKQQTVDWVAEDPPTANWNASLAEYGGYLDMTVGAFASASGHVLGQDLRTTTFDDLAFLVEGGGVAVYNFQPRDDGTVRVKVSFPVS